MFKKLVVGTLCFFSFYAFAQLQSVKGDILRSTQAASKGVVVNTASGDLSYTLPLLNIPSPEGSFPVKLSYHAGIATEQDAGWIGLGWGFNPGAIVRSPNGFADDYDNAVEEVVDAGDVTFTTKRGLFSRPKETTRRVVRESVSRVMQGALYPAHDWNEGQDYAFDTYVIPNMDQEGWSERSADEDLGGAFINFDNYAVSGPISGALQPYIVESGGIHRETTNTNGTKIEYFKTGNDFESRANFRMKGEFSNALLLNNTLDPSAFSSMSAYLNHVEQTTLPFSEYYNGAVSGDKKLATSYAIEWFTNAEINTGTAQQDYGFISHEKPNVLRDLWVIDPNYEVHDQIGGFMITTPEGISYHYSLPVYAYEEFHKYIKNNSNRLIKHNQPYAYQWLLTAITGPAYVDNAPSGLDENDLGYWVKMNYGKWTSSYQWRSPKIGYHDDLDNNLKYYSSGKRELYYLDYIQTRTHTALFVKEPKADGLGAAGGDMDRQDNYDYYQPYVLGDCEQVTRYPIAQLALKEIILFKNEQLRDQLQVEGFSSTDGIKELGNTYFNTFLRARSKCYASGVTIITSTVDHQFNSIIDDGDYETLAGLKPQIHLKLNQDYTLCGSSRNSYLYQDIFNNVPKTFTGSSNSKGKLTLNSISYVDDLGEPLLPETKFYYGQYKQYTFGQGGDPRQNPNYNQERSGYQNLYSNSSIDNVHPLSSSQGIYADAWSLQEITTPLGSKVTIEYEADKYKKSVLNPVLTTELTKVTSLGNDEYTFKPKKFSINLTINSTDATLFLAVLHPYSTPSGKNFEYEIQSIEVSILNYQMSSRLLTIKSAELTALLAERLDTGGKDYRSPVLGKVIISFSDESYYSGGIRVKSVSVDNGRKVKKVVYDYEDGVISHTPELFDQLSINYPSLLPSYFDINGKEELETEFSEFIWGLSQKVSVLGHHLPVADVLYGKVTEKIFVKDHKDNILHQHPITTVNTFSVFEEDKTLTATYSPITTAFGTQHRSLVIRDLTASLGLPIKTETFAQDGTPLGLIDRQYILDGTLVEVDQKLSNINYQGRFDQVIHEHREIDDDEQHLIVTKLESYPNMLLKTTNTDHKKGITQSTEVKTFDPLTGAPTSVISEDGMGRTIKIENRAAYHEYPEMASKSVDKAAKNILVPTANEASFVLDATEANAGLLSGGLQTWKFRQNTWRPFEAYRFTGTLQTEDGSTDLTEWTAEPFTNYHEEGNELTNWEKVSTIQAYDEYGHITEEENILSQTSAITLMDEDRQYVLATATNCTIDELAFSSAEFGAVEGNVSIGLGIQSANFAHTGTKSVLVNSGSSGFTFSLSPDINKTIKTMVWVYLPNLPENEFSNVTLQVSTNGNPIAQVNPSNEFKSKSWHLLSVDADLMVGQTYDVEVLNNSSGTVYMDDFRVQPIGASVAAFVYDLITDELIYNLNNDNLYLHFEYDNLGNSIRTYKEFFYVVDQLVEEKKYNFSR